MYGYANLCNILGRGGELVGTDQHARHYFALKGRVYLVTGDQENWLQDQGDYFDFMKAPPAGFTPADSLQNRTQLLMHQHLEAGSHAERLGQDRAPMNLRYIGNMLAALLRGGEAHPVRPV